MPSKWLNLVKLLMVNIYRDLLAWGSPNWTGVVKRDTMGGGQKKIITFLVVFYY